MSTGTGFLSIAEIAFEVMIEAATAAHATQPGVGSRGGAAPG